MKAICLNLISRPDRWELAQKEFERQNLQVDRFLAIPNDDRFLSFNLSQQAILRHIVNTNEETIVFEDDVKFVNDNMQNVLNTAPQNWQMLYLSGHVLRPLKKINKEWWRCKHTHTTHSVIYKPETAQYILDQYDPFKSGIYDDFLLRCMQPKINAYICKPFITTQRPGYSDLWQTETDYGIIHTESKLL
jgi:GR25 family glycosyltransferase involved in LPS biosynthesis